MRFILLALFVVTLSCSPTKKTESSAKVFDSSVSDSIVLSVVLQKPTSSTENLNWSSLVELIESLHSIPANQRAITLQSIKEEALRLNKQTWPEQWNTNATRSRYNVFLTQLSLAADQRYGENAFEKQALSIVDMKTSWNIFTEHLKSKDTLAIFEPTLR